VTPVGDVEMELVVRIPVRGRVRDLARLLQALNKADVVVMCLVEKRAPLEEQGETNLATILGGLSG
jgi:hypothetical protein